MPTELTYSHDPVHLVTMPEYREHGMADPTRTIANCAHARGMLRELWDGGGGEEERKEGERE